MMKILSALILTIVVFSTIRAEGNYLECNCAIDQLNIRDTLDARNDFSKGIEGVKAMALKGKKVFVESADSIVCEYALEYVKDWKYWKVVDNIEEADFILKVEMEQETNVKWQLFAVFLTPLGKEIYKSSPAKKYGLGKLKAREASTSYLINNIIKPFFELE